MDKPEPLKLDPPEYDYCDAEWTPLMQWLFAITFTGLLFFVAAGIGLFVL